MDYIQHQYAIGAHQGIPIDRPTVFDMAAAYPSEMHRLDGYFYSQAPLDTIDCYSQPVIDYEEYAENLSRPRLTKVQVETLEAQFQAHPKPSSNIKRQLAAQTNLSLPRVANWFQNRRAKAKQQRRQEEFERMQREKREAEEAARRNSGGINQSSQSDEDRPQSGASERLSASESSIIDVMSQRGKQQTDSSAAKPKHRKTRSEVAREATFASLQRALNAAVAGREQYNSQCENILDVSVSPGTVISPNTRRLGTFSTSYDSHEQGTFSHRFADLEAGQSSSASCGSQTTNGTFGYDDLNAVFTPTEGSLNALALDDVPREGSNHGMPSQDIQFQPPVDEWVNQAEPQTFSAIRAASDAGISYNTVQYPLQAFETPLLRRGSSGGWETQFEAADIHYNTQRPASHFGWTAAPARETGKEVDIAARRKRPRPSAIGISGPSRTLTVSAAMSPTKASNANPSVKQSKSAQNLGSWYAGVKKTTAPQRSLLNLSAFADSGPLNAKGDMSSIIHLPSTNNPLAPPTPITPETLNHLLPVPAANGGYCLSAAPSTQFFPINRSTPANIASPPATPLSADMISQFPYPHVPPPMSAPAQYATFSDYGYDDASFVARTFAASAPGPSLDIAYQSRCQIPQGNISSIGYDETVERSGQIAHSGTISQQVGCTGHHTNMFSAEEAAIHGFESHEFPDQY